MEPDHPELLTIDGMIALRRDDPDRALVLLSAANKAQPNDTRVLYALGFAYLGKDMLAFAEQAFRRVLELNPAISSLHGLVAAGAAPWQRAGGGRSHGGGPAAAGAGRAGDAAPGR